VLGFSILSVEVSLPSSLKGLGKNEIHHVYYFLVEKNLTIAYIFAIKA
jgi:hypothetical protein